MRVRRPLLTGALIMALMVPAVPGSSQPPAPGPTPTPPAAKADSQTSPMAKAVQTGQRVELTGERTETSQTYANPDGTKTLEQHPAPVRVRRGTQWIAPDPTLRKATAGTVVPAATVSPITLSGGGSSPLVTIGKPGASLQLGWAGRLPTPHLKGATATYGEVLPGVDLQVTVGVDGFSHLLVVKNREAALNPALRKLRYPVRLDGLTLKVGANGTSTAADKSGRAVFTAATAMMWDTPVGAKVPKQARVGLTLAKGKELVLTPDMAMLTDPAARFPLTIDPSFSGPMVRWLHVNSNMGNQDGWGYDTGNGGAKVGLAWRDTSNLYRSLFVLGTTSGAMSIGGATIIDATFRITLDHSPTGTATPVELWQLPELKRTDYLNWATTGNYWLNRLDTRSGNAWTGHQPDQLMEFNSTALKALVQTAADNRAPTVSLGLKAENENLESQWKKFYPDSATLAIKYNSTPRTPKGLTLSRPRPCGTAAAPTRIGTATPQFAAVGNDPDVGDNLVNTLQIRDTSGGVVYQDALDPVASGAAFSWPEVPAGKLTPGVAYRYRAFTADAIATGAATPDCYFVVDSVAPTTPVIQSTDFPDGEEGLKKANETGSVKFLPGGGDTDVAEYAYGFLKDKLTMVVKAGADGTATVPITIPPNPQTQVPSLNLYVKAVDQAGKESAIRPLWKMYAQDPVGDPPKVRGDANGDGLADVTSLFDLGFGRTTAWNFISKGGTGFHTGVIGWDTQEGGGFSLYRTRSVQGDLNGDGRTDLAVFREGAGRQVWLYKVLSDGNRYDSGVAVWTSRANSWPLSTARVVSGDVDHDGKDDIVVQNAGTANNWQALVFRAADNFATPVTWAQAATGSNWSQSAPLLADVDGDGRSDLVSMRNLTGCRTAIDVYRSTGTAFAAANTVYDSGAGAYCWERSKPVVADPDGDGKDDIVALYEYAANDAGLTVFRSTGTTFTPSSWWRKAGDLDLSKATLSAGDFDGDHRDDAAIVYAGGSVGDRQIYTYHSTGTTFADKALGWSGPVGAVTGPKFDIENRQYELVNRNSGRCLNVEGATADNGSKYIQYQCGAVDLNARFRVVPIPGTDQYSLRPAHTAVGDGPVKCADVLNADTADGAPVIQYLCGGGTGDPFAHQQMTVDYVDGSSYDTVVQLRFAHSGKCATVKDAGTADLVPVVQQTCGQVSNQQWILRPAYNTVQLGGNGTARYRVEAATSNTKVLDVIDCEDTDPGRVRMWNWVPGSPCQAWQLQSLGDDVYKIIDPDNGKALDVDGCSKVPKGQIQVFSSNDSECQKWRIEPTPGGSFSVLAVSTGLALDVLECNPAEGTRLITWFYHGGACQRWFFKQP
ncbi:RICIN domain-containing protein [Kribbella sp. NBC_01505]|uniref:RICIN domain-containing protein n=1 Tax=Kribbella sp. NBC_01505 TaxID=2903580 RepID=UPI00386B353D